MCSFIEITHIISYLLMWSDSSEVANVCLLSNSNESYCSVYNII